APGRPVGFSRASPRTRNTCPRGTARAARTRRRGPSRDRGDVAWGVLLWRGAKLPLARDPRHPPVPGGGIRGRVAGSVGRPGTTRWAGAVECAAMSSPAAADAYTRYQPWRRGFEIGFWLVVTLVNAVGNSLTALVDIRRSGLDYAAWEPVVWEWSSGLAWLA